MLAAGKSAGRSVGRAIFSGGRGILSGGRRTFFCGKNTLCRKFCGEDLKEEEQFLREERHSLRENLWRDLEGEECSLQGVY